MRRRLCQLDGVVQHHRYSAHTQHNHQTHCKQASASGSSRPRKKKPAMQTHRSTECFQLEETLELIESKHNLNLALNHVMAKL